MDFSKRTIAIVSDVRPSVVLNSHGRDICTMMNSVTISSYNILVMYECFQYQTLVSENIPLLFLFSGNVE